MGIFLSFKYKGRAIWPSPGSFRVKAPGPVSSYDALFLPLLLLLLFYSFSSSSLCVYCVTDCRQLPSSWSRERVLITFQTVGGMGEDGSGGWRASSSQLQWEQSAIDCNNHCQSCLQGLVSSIRYMSLTLPLHYIFCVFSYYVFSSSSLQTLCRPSKCLQHHQQHWCKIPRTGVNL